MSKSIKKVFTALLAVVAIVAVAFGFSAFSGKVFADVQTNDALGVKSGAEFRIPSAEESDDYYGIRFTGTITKAQFDLNKATEKNVVYGMEIAPADAPASAVDVLAGEAEGSTLKVTFASEEATEGTFIGSIVKIQEKNLTRGFIARSYYEVDGETRQYSDWSDAKIIFTMAAEYISKVDEVPAAVSAIVNNVTDTDKAGHYVENSFSITAEGKELSNLADGDKIVISTSVKSSINESTVLNVTPVVAASTLAGNAFGTYNVAATLEPTETAGEYTLNAANGGTFTINATVGNITKTVECSIPQVTLAKGTVATNKSSLNYAVTTELAEGDIMKIAFTGKNIPNVRLFSESYETQFYSEYKGYMFGHANTPNINRLYACGPTSSAVDGYFGRTSISGENLINSDGSEPDAYGNLTDGMDYTLNISYFKNASSITLNYTVKDSSGEEINPHTLSLGGEYGKVLAESATGFRAMLFGNAINNGDIACSYSIEKGAWIDITEDNFNVLKKATSGMFRLVEDIDMNNIGKWTHISSKDETNEVFTFTGLFDGQGHTISNIVTDGLFSTLDGTVKNVVFKKANYASSQDGIVADVVRHGKVENVIIETVAETSSSLGGILCRYVQGAITIENVIVITSTLRTDNAYGFIGGFTPKQFKVTANNCYFVCDNETVACGVRTGDYYNDVWSEDTTKTHLQTSADDTRYSNFFKEGSTFEIYRGATQAAALENFKNADKTIGVTLERLWAEYTGTNQGA